MNHERTGINLSRPNRTQTKREKMFVGKGPSKVLEYDVCSGSNNTEQVTNDTRRDSGS